MEDREYTFGFDGEAHSATEVATREEGLIVNGKNIPYEFIVGVANENHTLDDSLIIIELGMDGRDGIYPVIIPYDIKDESQKLGIDYLIDVLDKKVPNDIRIEVLN